MTEHGRTLTRRQLLELGLALPPLAALAGADLFAPTALAATPELLEADDEPSPALAEGPYFTPSSPRRRSIGHQLTDSRGRYTLHTVVPGIYPGRTRHIHVKVQAPRGRVLATQLFFPGVGANRSDGIYTPECLVEAWRLVEGRRAGRFDFVLAA